MLPFKLSDSADKEVCNHYMYKRNILFIFFLFFLTVKTFAIPDVFERVSVRSGLFFYNQDHTVDYLDVKPIAVYVEKFQQEYELTLRVKPEFKHSFVTLGSTQDIEIKDSLLRLDSTSYRFTFTFNLPLANYLSSLPIIISGQQQSTEQIIHLLPIISPSANFLISTTELYIGEEKGFFIEVNNSDFFRINSEWNRIDFIDYRLSHNDQNLKLYLVARNVGKHTFTLNIPLTLPMLVQGRLVFEYSFAPIVFTVNKTRIAFLNFEKKEITLDDAARREGVVLYMDNHTSLEIGRTYKVEDVEKNDKANPLIAELYVAERARNNKVKCILRPEQYHQMQNGYLYLKMDGQTRFIINLNITPPLQITNMMVMHEGGVWSDSRDVNPGETVFVKIDGVSLHKSKLSWEGDAEVSTDTTQTSEIVKFYKVKIPLTTTSDRIVLKTEQGHTGRYLQIKEYQRARPFDFISIHYNKVSAPLSQLNTKTYISRQSLKDVVFEFNKKIIDQPNDLYGKQYLNFDINYIGAKGELIEFQKIDNLVVTPSESSVRGQYYKRRGRDQLQQLSLDSLFHFKMKNLDDYSKITVNVSHSSQQYTAGAKSKEIEIVVQRPFRFDIDVSLPAGMMIQNLGLTKTEIEARDTWQKSLTAWQEKLGSGEIFVTGTDKNGNLVYNIAQPEEPKKANFRDNIGNISIAVIAQISFPDPNRVGRIYPWRIGVGVLVLNALNLASSTPSDLAGIAVFSIYPLRNSKLFNLPIHLGVGYKINERIPFIMLSPGISVRF